MFHVEQKAPTLETSKSQFIRLLDVYALGPFMLYVAYKAKNLSSAEKAALAGIGAATMYYNGKNYLATNASRRG